MVGDLWVHVLTREWWRKAVDGGATCLEGDGHGGGPASADARSEACTDVRVVVNSGALAVRSNARGWFTGGGLLRIANESTGVQTHLPLLY